MSRAPASQARDPRPTQAFYATKPTAPTRFFRTFLPYQILRFLFINLKMLQIIRISHRPR